MSHLIDVFAWWIQLKASRAREGKAKVMSWNKLKSKMRKTFLPYNYEHLMFQCLHNLRQGSRFVADYATNFFLLLNQIDLHNSTQQVVA